MTATPRLVGAMAAQRLRRRGSLGLLGAALLAGCAVGPNYRAPAPPVATGFTRHPLPEVTTASSTPGGQAQRFVAADLPGRWWELFQSPALNRLVERALASNPDLQSAQAALRVARENHKADKGALFPQVEADFSASRQKNPADLASPLANNAEYFGLNTGQLQITYAPDLFGGVRRQVESSAAEVQNQRFTLEAAYLTLTTNVVVAALQEASLRGQIEATQRSVALGETVLKQLAAARRAGEIAAGDVAAQEAALAQARLSLPPLEKQLAQQQDLLAVLTGGLPSETADDTIELADLQLPTTLPVTLPAQIVQQRPDIRAAEANLHAASALIGVAVANRLPNVTLTGLYGGESEQLSRLFAPENNLWALTAGVTQPIFEGGTLRHKQRAAEAAYDQAAAQYRSTVHTAFQNVADTLEALDQDAKALKATAEAQRATAASLEIARREFRYGEVNSVAVLNAQQAEAAASLVLVQAQGARYADTAALFQALGGGWWNRADSPTR